DPTSEPMGARQALAPTPTPTPVVSVSPGDHRVGGTPGAPQPPTPGWAWWVGAATVVALGAGGVRLWRNRPTDDERWTDDEFWTEEQGSTHEQSSTQEQGWPEEQRWPEEQTWPEE